MLSNSKQVVLMQDSCHPFVICDHSSQPQFGRHPSIPVALPILQGNLRNGRSRGQLLLSRPASPQIAIKFSSADLCQMAHSLDAQAALQRHPCPYFTIDAFSPEAVPRQRRAPTFCKALLKKSTSIVLFASSRFSLVISFRRMNSRDRVGEGIPSSNRSRQLYSSLRCMRSSLESLRTLSHNFICWTAWCRNS